jgi:hypothetical protein
MIRSKLFSHISLAKKSFLGCSCSLRNESSVTAEEFRPKKALILTKVSRYEYERFRHPDMNETQFELALKKRGSDYAMIRFDTFELGPFVVD